MRDVRKFPVIRRADEGRVFRRTRLDLVDACIAIFALVVGLIFAHF